MKPIATKGAPMKIKVTVSMGLVGCKKNEVVNVDDEEIDGMTDEEREEYFDELASDVMHDIIEYCWEVVEE